MDKLIWLPSIDDDGRRTSETLFVPNNTFEKVAADYSKNIQEYISRMSPDVGKYLYMLLHAVGAEEAWGSNVNGDSFPEKGLSHEGEDYGFKTFERFAKLYKHHINKDPKRSYGEVQFADYDPAMRRVLLVVAVDRSKAPDICQKIEIERNFPDVSMGCKVPWDECSICMNRAKAPKNYCDHARDDMNVIYPDGRKVFVRNHFPRFFDISYVFKGAEAPAKFIHKIAGDSSVSMAQRYYWIGWEPSLDAELEKAAINGSVIPSSVMAEKIGYVIKDATMIKEVPAGETGQEPDEQIQSIVERGLGNLRASEQYLPSDVLDTMSQYPLRKTLATLTSLGIPLKPREFQRIVLNKMGMSKEARFFDEMGIVFSSKHASNEVEPLSFNFFDIDQDIVKLAQPYMAGRSDLQPHMFNRTMNAVHGHAPVKNIEKDYRKGETNVATPLSAIAMLYIAYKAGLLEKIQPLNDAVDTVADFAGVKDVHPATVVTLAAAAAAGIQGMKGFMRNPDTPTTYLDEDSKIASAANIAILGGAALAPYVYREHVKNKAYRGEEVGTVDRLIYHHPGKAALISMYGTAKYGPKAVAKAKKMMDYVSGLHSAGKQLAQSNQNVVESAKRMAQTGYDAMRAARMYSRAKMGSATNNVSGMLSKFISKLGNDRNWDSILNNVVLNPEIVMSKVASDLNDATANAGTMLGLAVLGCKEDA